MASSSSKLTTTTTTASKAIRRVKLTKTIQKTLPDVSVPITVLALLYLPPFVGSKLTPKEKESLKTSIMSTFSIPAQNEHKSSSKFKTLRLISV